MAGPVLMPGTLAHVMAPGEGAAYLMAHMVSEHTTWAIQSEVAGQLVSIFGSEFSAAISPDSPSDICPESIAVDVRVHVHEAGMYLFEIAEGGDPLYFTVRRIDTDAAVGMVSFLSIDPPHRHLELGNIWYLPEAQRTRVNTETVYLMMEEAFERFRETFKDNPEIYRGIGEDVLPASLEIRLEDPSMADRVAERLQGEEGIGEEDLNYPRQTIDRLNTVTGYMVWGLYGATALFLIASVLLISNAIRLSIFARRKEIEVMKLVGASDGFVRWPFVFEGLLQGLVGAGLAAIVVVWLNFLFVDWARDALPFVPISSGAVDTLFVLLVLVAVGVAIGVVGSFLSVTRFLKV